MSSEWQRKCLKDVCEKITDGTHQTPKYFESGIKFLSSKNVTSGQIDWENIKYIDEAQHEKMHKRLAPRRNDILLAKNGTTGVAALVDCDTTFDIYVSLALLRPLDALDPKYLLHFINSPIAKQQFNRRLKGVGVPNLHLKEIREVQIEFPSSISEQKRIVAILDEAFGAIARAKENAERNLANARELFDSYLNRVFTEKGEGWEEKRLVELFEIGSSKRILESEWTNSGVPFYGGKEIVKLAKFGSVISNAYISEEKYREYESKYDMPRKGDILMTARGTIGVGYVVKEDDTFYYKDGNIISFREKVPMNPHFVLYAFRSDAMLEQFMDLTGTTVKHLPIRKAKALVLNTPSYVLQNKLVKQIGIVENEAKRLENIYTEKLAALDELKQSLLQKAFTGQLTSQSKELELVP